jgi:protein TonB
MGTGAGTGTGTGTGAGAGTVAGTGPDTESDPAPDSSAIRSAIAASIHYPRLARTQGLQGTALVRFHIDAQGQPTGIAILTSAGTLLDAAARDAVLRAAPYRSPPGWVRVPVIFSLHDAP